MFIGKYNKSVILTYVGVAVSAIGMYFAIKGAVKYAVSCLIIAGICDLFDGKIARMCNRTEEEKRFGVQIDSLADIFNFIAFPVVIFINIGLNSVIDNCICIFYILAGIIRLAHFNMNMEKIEDTDVPIRFFTGLPVTYSALIFGIGFMSSFFLKESYFMILYRLLIIGTGIAFILDIKIPKPRGYAYIFFSLLAVLSLLFLCIV